MTVLCYDYTKLHDYITEFHSSVTSTPGPVLVAGYPQVFMVAFSTSKLHDNILLLDHDHFHLYHSQFITHSIIWRYKLTVWATDGTVK
jgi:hypothetical protein